MARDPDDGDIIDVTPTASLSHDMMLLKMDHESIRAAAMMKPRNNAAVLKELIATIDAYPAAADDAIYSKPVGTVWAIKCGKCGNRYEASDRNEECAKCGSNGHERDESRKVKKFAENLSIRAAETIASIYGANSLRVAEEPLPDGRIRLTGVFVDYATATMRSDERIVSPWYKKRGGGMEKMAEDRFLNLTVKAEKAKLRRDLILDTVPAVLKAAFRDACEKKIVATVTAGYIEEQILPFLPNVGLSLEEAEAIVGKPKAMGWAHEDVATLRKVCSGLKNGEFTKKQLFDELRDVMEDADADAPRGRGDVATNPAAAAGAVTGDDLANAGKTKSKGKTRGKPEGDAEPAGDAKTDPPTSESKSATEPSTPSGSGGTLFGVDEDGPDGEGLGDSYVRVFEARAAEADNLRDLDTLEIEFKACTKFNKAERKTINLAIAKRRKELKS